MYRARVVRRVIVKACNVAMWGFARRERVIELDHDAFGKPPILPRCYMGDISGLLHLLIFKAASRPGEAPHKGQARGVNWFTSRFG